jgi:monoamine oxidase
MGVLWQGNGTKVEVRLIDLVFYDLAKLHNLTYDELEEEMLHHYAHGWNRHENALGGITLFRPEQFPNSYPSLLKPAGKGKLNFVGKAVSRQHGWVSGSLNSAWRVIDDIFNPEGDRA